MILRSFPFWGTQVSRGTDRSSMEALLLTCIQAQVITGRIQKHPHLSERVKNDLVWEVKQATKEECKVDAND